MGCEDYRTFRFMEPSSRVWFDSVAEKGLMTVSLICESYFEVGVLAAEVSYVGSAWTR
jgi:hypothetical protein